MKTLLLALSCVTAAAQPTAPREIKVAVDPRSPADAQAHLIAKGFLDFCPNVSVIRDQSDADYIALATESDGLRGALLHYYITLYDKQGKVVFATDKHHGKAASKDACRFINSQR